MILRFFIIITLFFIAPGLKGQTIETWIEKNEKVPVEKLYIHTDRAYYFSGETIWLKAYLTDSRSGKLIPGAENIYIHLIDDAGRKVFHKNLMSVNGQVPGHIDLPDTLASGQYLLQAYTDYLLNFGEEAFFYKTLGISRTARSARTVEARQRMADRRRMVADVSFLPEGGKILEGLSNVIAFKAVDRQGYGVDASGAVLDESGNEVVAFNTDYRGMGLFFLKPQPGKTYHATINGFPSFRYDFDSLIVSEGIKIQLVNQTKRELLINASFNASHFQENLFYLVNMHHGEVVFYQPFKVTRENQLLKFNSQILRGGINRLVLLDKNLRPVSERLLFSDNYEVNEIDIRSTRDTFRTRSEVTLQISGDENHSDSSNLSLAVVHEAAFGGEDPAQHILSYMLIDSELNGFIENPADYFVDSDISALSKQRLLMLTNGWSSYFWNGAPGVDDTLEHQQKVGLSLRGIATDIMSGQPLKDGEITLAIEKDNEMAFLTQPTDDSGEFVFSGLLFKDTANVYVQARNESGKQNTSISLIPETDAPALDVQVSALSDRSEIPSGLEIQKYNHDLVYGALARKRDLRAAANARQENEIQSGGDGHFRIYDEADQVIEIPEADVTYGNVIDYLVGKVAGLDISGDQIVIRGTSNFEGQSAPLFLIDGVPVTLDLSADISPGPEAAVQDDDSNRRNSALEKIKSIPIQDIDKVEILKSPQNLTMFGMEGANGVIAIYTNRGKSLKASSLARGVIKEKISGYSSFREFYAPTYTPGNPESDLPDFRTTLFWNPEIVLQNGRAEVSFFSSDETGRYRIIAEGIDGSGIVCMGAAGFEVIDQGD